MNTSISRLFIKIRISILCLFGLSVSTIHSQVIRSFTQRAAAATPTELIYNIKGDYTMIGNTNLTLDVYDNNTNNSNNLMVYVDVDGDPNTLNSSSATLDFSTENGANPLCSRVLFAGLYWTGRASNSSSSPESFTVTKGAVTKNYNKRTAYIKGPGQTGYTQLIANPGNIYYPTTSEGFMYSAFIEVTDYVKTCGLGSYTVADLALIEGNGGSTGYYGGWGMIVVYENSKMNWRDVTIFDGHAYVTGNATLSYELPVSGFNTAQAGPINMKLGLMAGEGDVGISGDYFKIRNYQDNAWVTLNHSGNSTTNFFNGSVNTGGNTRNPNLQNNTGLDMAMFYVPNIGNTVITNNQTSTKFQYGSTQDTYIIFCIAMSVDAYIPDVSALVATETINGVPVGSGPLTVQPGQDIEYKVQIRNQGTEAINNTIFTIPIPYTTTYVTNSASVAITFTPSPTPNTVTFDPNIGLTGALVWNFGTLPLIPGFPDSVLAELTFHFTVTNDCNILKNPDCPPKVTLSGSQIGGVGATSGANFNLPFIQGYQSSGPCTGEPISDPLEIAIDAAAYNAANCSGIPAYRKFKFCNYTLPTIPVDSIAQGFPVGLEFYNTNNITPTSIQYDQNNPFPATVGTYTYFAIPVGIPLCYYTFSIHVSNITSVPAVSDQIYCLNDPAAPISGTPSDPSYTIAYYTSLNSTTPNYTITPSTATPGITTYYFDEGDTANCMSSKRDSMTVTIYDLIAPSINPANVNHVLCKGDLSGTALVNVNGGNSNYSYSWSTNPSQITSTATGLGAGIYSVTITDNSGCAVPATATVNITEPSVALSASISSVQNIDCFGNATGSATVTPTGGSLAYNYSWNTNPAQTTSVATGLLPGNYTVSIFDQNGCSVPAEATVTITQPPGALSTSVALSSYNGQNISCSGMADGSIQIVVSGGSPGYTYSWSNGNTTSALTGLTAGNYSVVITDNNGCWANASYTLIEPTTLMLTASVTSNYNGQNIRCNGLADGAATASVTGGTPGYQYVWNNGATTALITGITAGGYTVTTTDLNGCTSTTTLSLTQPQALTNTLTITSNYNGQNISCSGAADGSIGLITNGGTPGYSYNWSNGSTTQNLSGLNAGSYVIILTDSNGCVSTGTISLTEPGAFNITSVSNPVICNGQANGSIDLNVSGGTPGYTYNWNNGSTTQDISGLAAGNYIVTLLDTNGCQDVFSFNVAEPDPIILAATHLEPKCYQSMNGAISYLATGGTMPYDYLWSTGDTVNAITGIGAGAYAITVTDSNMCTATDTIILYQPDSLELIITSDLYANGFNVSLNNMSDGTIDLTVTGGTWPYGYFWSNGYLIEDPYNIPAGTYTVQITDANGCQAFGIITLTEPFPLELPTGFTPNNDGSNDYLVVHGLESYPDNEISVYNRWGNVVFSATGYDNKWDGRGTNGKMLPAATYFVVLTIHSPEKIILNGYLDMRR